MARKKKLKLTWRVCGDDGHWCDFLMLNLNTDLFIKLKGVYIIWSGEQILRVGSGTIKDLIAAHRKDGDITAYKNLKVTWAKTHANKMEGVEKYLSDTLKPAVGDAFPERKPIPVNLPW